ncbi:MAG TPA: hypothetical protein PKV74_03475 [Syntrophales bacterium]|nr:hypothetical protein [Syntrophales bacterium]
MLRVAPRTKSFSRPPMSGRKRRLFLPAAAALLLALLFTAGCPVRTVAIARWRW